MKRRKFGAKMKAQVALEAIKNDATIEELAQRFDVHPSQVRSWKVDFLTNAEKVFIKDGNKGECDDKHVAELERKVGQQAIEIDFLKKNYMKYRKGNG
jgi:transposase-like protein